MNDDWRLRADLHEAGKAHEVSERLDASEIEHKLETAFSDRAIVSVDGPHLFCYTGTREQAEAAQRFIQSLADGHGWQADFELARWHPSAEAWENPDLPLPDTDEQWEAERAELVKREREESAAQGYPDYEVRVEFDSERDCEQFADQLHSEGIPVVRRHKFLVVGATDEESAHELAARIQREAPAGSSVSAEGTVSAVFDGHPMSPFAVFGGLGG